MSLFVLYTTSPSGIDRRLEADGKRMLHTHKAFVFGEEHGDSSVDLADSQGYQHGEVVALCRSVGVFTTSDRNTPNSTKASWSCRVDWRAMIGAGRAAASSELAVYISQITRILVNSLPLTLHIHICSRGYNVNCYWKNTLARPNVCTELHLLQI